MAISGKTIDVRKDVESQILIRKTETCSVSVGECSVGVVWRVGEVGAQRHTETSRVKVCLLSEPKNP